MQNFLTVGLTGLIFRFHHLWYLTSMASHGYLGDPGEYTPSRYHWQCPLCPYELTAVTEGGRRSLSGFHMDGHVRKDRERMALFASMPNRSPEYYQILRLTWADIQFL